MMNQDLPMLQKAKSYFLLVRPHNSIIGGLSVFIGAFLTGRVEPFGALLSACASAAFITAGANSINDYFDVESDRINKPYRAIPSGNAARSVVKRMTFLLYAVGLVFSSFVNSTAMIIASTAVILTYLYSAWLKRIPFWGNLTVASLTSLAFIYGGVAVGRVIESLIPATFSLFYHFGREVLKDIEDIEGDRKAGLNTFPIKYGIEPSLKLAGFSFGFLIILTFLPFIFDLYNIIYLIVVLLGVDLVLMYTMISARRDPESANLKKLNTVLKADMLVGLTSIYLGTI